ncbi:hypothetical protein QR680_011474 [Steinernema hermaphroditum]|uniref:N-acetyltransferase domain-containing protein n=1 Tax=Steinernema hermaphroditum TaxID=289476 RepID=A0AA39HYM3_9BILA|nr:hypothetical protein QR680_011474 [Steinernema hermaphroditum]
MVHPKEVVCRTATPDDAENLLAFMEEFLCASSVVCRAFGFDNTDSVSLYGPALVASLPDNYSAMAVDESTGEILGYGIASLWYRDPSRNRPYENPKLTEKAELLSRFKKQLRVKFWDLSPPDITCVLKGEGTCIRPDCRRMGIAQSMLDIPMRDPEIAGAVSVTSNYGSQRLTAKMGYVTLAEMDYASYFAENGLKFEGAFDDNTTKALLEFKPLNSRWISSHFSKI